MEKKKIDTKLLEMEKNKMKFVIAGIDYTTANSIRRGSYEIPVLAIDEVEFYANDSALYDEILAHRLGLIPIKTERSVKLPDEHYQEILEKDKKVGRSTYEVKLKLEAQGPGMIYAKQFKGEAKAIYPDMPIVWLEEGQSLKIVCIARLGKAKQHAKFSPGLIIYRPAPQLVGYDKEFVSKNKSIVNICPKKALKLDNGNLIVNNDCDLCQYCSEQFPGKINIKPKDDEFIFYVESWGQLKPQEIIAKSIEALNAELSALKSGLKKIKV